MVFKINRIVFVFTFVFILLLLTNYSLADYSDLGFGQNCYGGVCLNLSESSGSSEESSSSSSSSSSGISSSSGSSGGGNSCPPGYILESGKCVEDPAENSNGISGAVINDGNSSEEFLDTSSEQSINKFELSYGIKAKFNYLFTRTSTWLFIPLILVVLIFVFFMSKYFLENH